MNIERIDSVLATFRTWLLALHDPPPAPEEPAAAFDFATLVAQFTALRHDVNLQTKAVRGAVEQSAEVIKLLNAAPKAEPEDRVKPLLKALVDIADVLALAHKQVEKSTRSLDEEWSALSASDIPTLPEVKRDRPMRPPGFFARLFGAKSVAPPSEPDSWTQWANDVLAAEQRRTSQADALRGKLQPLIRGMGEGYAMSLRRVERTLAEYDLIPIPCLGQPFDPETMEVIEAVSEANRPSGQVVEELKRGYTWKGRLFRTAQVKVAR